jgi:hypothetical protein
MHPNLLLNCVLELPPIRPNKRPGSPTTSIKKLEIVEKIHINTEHSYEYRTRNWVSYVHTWQVSHLSEDSSSNDAGGGRTPLVYLF